MHTLAGPSVGIEKVIQGTVSTLASYADRAVVGEDVIWSEDAPGLYLSSHRITSHGTHLGDDSFGGDASMVMSGVTTIADCLVRANLIVEEWLVRDNLLAVQQMGREPTAARRSRMRSIRPRARCAHWSQLSPTRISVPRPQRRRPRWKSVGRRIDVASAAATGSAV